MSLIIPSRSAGVTSRRVRSGRARSAASHAPRFSAALLAEVESRYAALLALVVPLSEGCALSEPTTVTLGTPMCDQVAIEAALAMWAEDNGARSFAARLHIAGDPVELDPRQARDAAEALRAIADRLVALAADAEALTEIEAERR